MRASQNYGTGTTITVSDDSYTTTKTYEVVIFGDVDGNGLINISDVTNTVARIDEVDLGVTDDMSDFALAQVIAMNAAAPGRGDTETKQNALYEVSITDVTTIAEMLDYPYEAQFDMASTHYEINSPKYA